MGILICSLVKGILNVLLSCHLLYVKCYCNNNNFLFLVCHTDKDEVGDIQQNLPEVDNTSSLLTSVPHSTIQKACSTEDPFAEVSVKLPNSCSPVQRVGGFQYVYIVFQALSLCPRKYLMLDIIKDI